MEINKFVRKVLRNNYRSCNLVGHLPVLGNKPKNSFTRPFLARRCVQAGHDETVLYLYGIVLSSHSSMCVCYSNIMVIMGAVFIIAVSDRWLLYTDHFVQD